MERHSETVSVLFSNPCQTIRSAASSRNHRACVFMRWLPQQLLQLLLLWLAPPARGGPAEPTTAVLELSASNFTASVTAPGARVLVQFYVPWCGFCKRLAGPYEEAAQRLRKLAQHDPTLVGLMARVNAEAERALASQHGAPPSRGYPSLWWFADGESREYRGGRAAADFVDFMMLRGGPLLTRLENASVAEGFRLSFPVAVVATLAEPASARAIHTLEEACRRAATAAVRCGLQVVGQGNAAADMPPTGAASSAPSVVLHRASDDASVPYSGDLATDGAAAQLVSFIEANELPPVTLYGPATQRILFDSAIDALVLFLQPGDSNRGDTAQEAAWREAFERAAHSVRGDALFASVPFQLHSTSLRAFFGMAHAPAIALYRKSSHRRFLLFGVSGLGEGGHPSADATSSSRTVSEAPAADEIVAAVRHALAQGSGGSAATPEERLGALLHTAAISPKPALPGTVATLVSSSLIPSRMGTADASSSGHADAAAHRPPFEAGVKDTLVLLHAPWCIACRWVADEVLPALAAQLAADSGILIAQIDVSANEPPMASALATTQPGSIVLLRANGTFLLYEATAVPNGHDLDADVHGRVQSLLGFIERERSSSSTIPATSSAESCDQ